MSRCLLSAVALALVFASVQCQRGPNRNSERAERDQTVEQCRQKVMDIYFILDSSSSIYTNDYDQQLQFVRQVVNRLDVNPRATRVGMLTFSDDITRPTVDLTQHSTKGDVLATINLRTLPYRTGYTNTHLAIRHVREDPDFRRDVTKVMVVVTDGGSRAPGSTAQEARLAREAGFYMFVVGIGQYLEESEWRSIASDPDSSFIFNITNFNFLESVQLSLPPRACALPPIILGGSCGISQQADLFFTAAPGGYQEAIQLIDHFTDKTTDDQDRLQVSYIMELCDGGANVALGNLDRYCSREANPPTATENTNRGLLERVRVLARDNRAQRGGVPQVLVLFMNTAMMAREGRTYDMWSLANSLREDGVEFVAVDLGMEGSRQETRRMRSLISGMAGGNPNKMVRFNPGSIVSQGGAQVDFVDKICQALNSRSSTSQPGGILV